MKKIFKYLLVVVAFSSGIIFSQEAQAKTDAAIIGATDCELFYLENSLSRSRTYKEHNLSITKGKIGRNSVVIVKSGIGKVNSATTTQFLIDKFKPAYVINIGVAGALSPKLKIGDIVIAKSLVQHDFDLSPIGYVKGAVDMTGPKDKPTYFKSDDKLTQALYDLKGDANISFGTIASGDVFVANSQTKAKIRNAFKADVVEMEGAAIAHAATLNNIPFVVLRIISDLADENNDKDYYQFKDEMSIKNAELLEKLLLNGKLSK